MVSNEPNITDVSSQDSIALQFEEIKKLINENELELAKIKLEELHPADIADLIDNCSLEQNNAILTILESNFDSESLAVMSSKSRLMVAEFYNSKILSRIVLDLAEEDAIEFMSEIPTEIKEEILELLPEKNRLYILEGFNYPENTAGRVMAKQFTYFYEHWTVGQSMDYVRSNPDVPDEFHAAVVINSKNKPVGTVTLSSLLKNQRSTAISEIMNKDLRLASTDTVLEDLTYIFKHYALTIVPVVNKVGKLVGTVSIDNIVYIIDEQAEDAILNLGGVYEIDIYDTFVTAAKHRFPWLFINLIAACVTSFVINNFGETIVKMVALASLMPIVASMGGNAGTQSMTVTIMALANKDINKYNKVKMILKELFTCGINGAVFASLGAAIVISVFGDILLAKIFALAVIINFLIGGILGSSIPIILDKLNQDPAPSSGVILNALTDGCGFLIFLWLAKLMLVS